MIIQDMDHILHYFNTLSTKDLFLGMWGLLECVLT